MRVAHLDKPLSVQEGGDHYKRMGIQPIEFAEWNMWDNTAFSILKYLSRHRTKNGLQDLKKALHFIDIRQGFVEAGVLKGRVYDKYYSMNKFCVVNNLPMPDYHALMALEFWVLEGGTPARLIGLIEGLMEEYDG